MASTPKNDGKEGTGPPFSRTETAISCLTVVYDLLLQYHSLLESAIRGIAPKGRISQQEPKNPQHQEYEEQLPWEALTGLLESPNEIIAGLAARDLAMLVRIRNDFIPSGVTDALLKWIGASLTANPPSEHETRMLLSTLLLEHLLQVPSLRWAFFEGGAEWVRRLSGPLMRSRNIQLQYQAIFALWLLTFDANIAGELQQRHPQLIPSLLDVAKGAIKEKIQRIVISTWRNLLMATPSLSLPVMIGARVLEYLENLLAAGRLTDEETVADITILREALLKAIQSLNSYDEYSSEVKSGSLDWSPPHKSELFWRDNAPRLVENDCELLRQLVRLLDPAHFDAKTVAIAAHDLGMYMEYHAPGRAHVERIGGKQRIMALITATDPDVRFQALSTMQKYMKKLWNPA